MLAPAYPSKVSDSETVGSRPQLATEDERLIAALAEQRLRSARYADFRRVTCRFADGALTLTGVVASFYLKQVAQATVRQIEEVSHIENFIRVCSGRAE